MNKECTKPHVVSVVIFLCISYFMEYWLPLDFQTTMTLGFYNISSKNSSGLRSAGIQIFFIFKVHNVPFIADVFP